MIHYKRAETTDELKQILRLQQKNLPKNLSSETLIKEGFVTVEHDLDILSQMNRTCPHFIALCDNEVVGYCLCMHPKFGDEIQILRPMFAEIGKWYRQDDYIVMGQICIDKDFRGKGIFRTLYKNMLSGIQPEFSTIITEVDLENSRSLNAHYAVGFRPICQYESNDHCWVLLKLDASCIR